MKEPADNKTPDHLHGFAFEDGFFSLFQGVKSEINDFLDSIHNPVVAVNKTGIITLCNRAFETVAGMDRAGLTGSPINTIFAKTRLNRIIETGKTESARKIRIDGRVFISHRQPILSDGEIVGAIGVLQDVSELEILASELKQTNIITDELNAIIESSFDGIFVTNGSGTVIRLNRAYERITGIKKAEVVGKKMNKLVENGFYNESVTMRVLKSGRPESIVQEVRSGKTVMVTGNPINDENGEIMLVVTNVRDVSELHKLQKDLCHMQALQSQYEIELGQLRGAEKEKFVIRSKKMKEVQALAIRLGQVDSTVLIQGESGVGKEMVAELVHTSGKRTNKPFIKINCAAIPENLLEAELFGYAPGAFTGASKKGKAGLFEAAEGGSIFMDEVSEMPAGLQVKILRVIQEREIVRVGDVNPIRVDVRIIAATNRNLEEMVRERTFRKDLFFRLNVVPVVIPPLRERKDALINFIYHFLGKYNRKFSFSKQIDPEAIEILNRYDWPGNVRELENVLERMIVVTPGDIITADDLPENFKANDYTTGMTSMMDKPLKTILEDVERKVIAQTLEKLGTTRKTAEALSVNQSTIVRKIARYGLRSGKSDKTPLM